MINGSKLLSDIKYYSSYAKYDEDNAHMESWEDSVDRVMSMHKTKFAELYDTNPEFRELFEFASNAYKSKYVLASQRSLQWAPDPILKHNSRMFNCLTLYADRPAFFQEVMYWLLSGCGVGFSVQYRHVNKIPNIRRRTNGVKTYVIDDSIEGWADSIGVLVSSFLEEGGTFPDYMGYTVHFDYSQIRPKGSKISGGFKAPGPDGLRAAHEKITELLQSQFVDGDVVKLKPIVVYDVVMHSSDAVLSGGVRRCLPKGYLVRTGVDTYKPIEECTIDDSVYYAGTLYPINALFSQGDQDLLRIDTSEGYHVSSYNHKWLVLNKKTGSIEWETAANISLSPSSYAFLREKNK